MRKESEVKEKKAPIYTCPKIPQPPTIRVGMRKPREHSWFSPDDVCSGGVSLFSHHNARGPGQRLGVAGIEVQSRLVAAGYEVTIRWVPAHAGAEGNEVADQYAKDAATGRALERGCQRGTRR